MADFKRADAELNSVYKQVQEVQLPDYMNADQGMGHARRYKKEVSASGYCIGKLGSLRRYKITLASAPMPGELGQRRAALNSSMSFYPTCSKKSRSSGRRKRREIISTVIFSGVDTCRQTAQGAHYPMAGIAVAPIAQALYAFELRLPDVFVDLEAEAGVEVVGKHPSARSRGSSRQFSVEREPVAPLRKAGERMTPAGLESRPCSRMKSRAYS